MRALPDLRAQRIGTDLAGFLASASASALLEHRVDVRMSAAGPAAADARTSTTR